ncbi:ROK family protein [Devosia sp.]|uniref:ROK family protein n=1 Tax=Devosia sp. TaxID=1871048 RepID=UPI003265C8E8
MSRSSLLSAIDAALANPEKTSGEAGAQAEALLSDAGWLAGSSPAGGLVIGLDLGGTKLLGAIGTANGAILLEREAPTESAASGSALEQISAMVEQLLVAGGISRPQIAQIVVGVPGVVAADGSVSLSPHVRFPAGQSLAKALIEATGLPVFVENDVNIAAYGEYLAQGDNGSGTLAFAALGTGIGIGLIVDGCIVRGTHGAAGEIGTMPFGTDPLAAAAAHPGGAYEAAVSTGGIMARYSQAGGQASSVRIIFERAEAGEPMAAKVIDASLYNLAVGLGAVVALLDPGVIVLGGGIGARPGVAEQVSVWLGKLVQTPCRVSASQLGARAGVIGALAQARHLAKLALVATAEGEISEGAGR